MSPSAGAKPQAHAAGATGAPGPRPRPRPTPSPAAAAGRAEPSENLDTSRNVLKFVRLLKTESGTVFLFRLAPCISALNTLSTPLEHCVQLIHFIILYSATSVVFKCALRINIVLSDKTSVGGVMHYK